MESLYCHGAGNATGTIKLSSSWGTEFPITVHSPKPCMFGPIRDSKFPLGVNVRLNGVCVSCNGQVEFLYVLEWIQQRVSFFI